MVRLVAAATREKMWSNILRDGTRFFEGFFRVLERLDCNKLHIDDDESMKL